MTGTEWIAKRRELLDAATDGPWYWRNTGAPYLLGKRSRVVMAFGRMGMQGAQPRFRDERGILQDGGRANLNSFPDARLIADARTSLPAALDALEAVLALTRPAGSERLGPDFDEHDELLDHGWDVRDGKAGSAGYNTDPTAGRRERIWFSPACIGAHQDVLDFGASA